MVKRDGTSPSTDTPPELSTGRRVLSCGCPERLHSRPASRLTAGLYPRPRWSFQSGVDDQSIRLIQQMG